MIMRQSANALRSLTTPTIALAMQVSAENPMDGLDGRAEVLRGLARAMKLHPDHFGTEGGGRPGGIVGTSSYSYESWFLHLTSSQIISKRRRNQIRRSQEGNRGYK